MATVGTGIYLRLLQCFFWSWLATGSGGVDDNKVTSGCATEKSTFHRCKADCLVNKHICTCQVPHAVGCAPLNLAEILRRHFFAPPRTVVHDSPINVLCSHDLSILAQICSHACCSIALPGWRFPQAWG